MAEETSPTKRPLEDADNPDDEEGPSDSKKTKVEPQETEAGTVAPDSTQTSGSADEESENQEPRDPGKKQ